MNYNIATVVLANIYGGINSLYVFYFGSFSLPYTRHPTSKKVQSVD